tara:strand:+ start:8444 stop:11164 length:2721 start_codon:yes stop_codon:yes gene_type:complete
MKVPTFQVQSQRTSEPNTSPLQAKANPNILASPQNAMADFANTAFNISSDFYKKELKIRDDRQLTEAVNAFSEGLNLASIEANKETDPGKIKPKFDELTATLLAEQSGTITSKAIRSVFESKGKSLLTNYNININNQVRTKEIKKDFGEKIVLEKKLIDDAINGNNAQKVAAFNDLFGNDDIGVIGLYDQMSGSLMDPGDAFNRSETVKKTIAKQTVIKNFNDLTTVETKQAFVANFKTNPPKALMPSTVDELTNKLTRAIDTSINKARTLKNIASKEGVAELLAGIETMSAEQLTAKFKEMGDTTPENLLLTVGDYTQARLTLQSRIRFLENQAELEKNKEMVANLGKLQLEVANAGDDEEKLAAILEKVQAIDPGVEFLKEGQIAAVVTSLNAKIKLLGKEDSADFLNNEKIKILQMQINGDLKGLNEMMIKHGENDELLKSDAGNYLSILGSLESGINKLESDLKSSQSALDKELKEFVSLIQSGGTVNEDMFTNLEERAANLGDYGQNFLIKLNQAKDLNNILGTMKTMTPSEIEAAVASFSGGVTDTQETPDGDLVTTNFGGPGVNTQFEKTLIKSSKTLLNNVRSGLKNDPLTWADTAGILQQPIQQLFFDPGDPGSSIQSFAIRKQQADQVAAHYGLNKVTFLKPNEKLELTDALYNGTKKTRLDLLNLLVGGFGADAPDVLGEISKSGPEFAHIGGLMNLGADRAVDLALDGLDLKKDGLTAPNFTTENSNIIFGIQVGNALGANMSMAGDLASGKNIASAIYLALATRKGFTDFDDGEYADAIQMAFGANLDNGTGGIQEIRNNPTLVPPGMDADMIETAINAMSQEYLRSRGYNVDPGLFDEITKKKSYYPIYKLMAVGNGLYQFQEDLTDENSVAADLDGNIIQVLISDLIEFQQ